MIRAHITCGAGSPSMSSIGLVAVGRCGSWGIDLDESLDGPQQWFMQIEGPCVALRFEIGAPQAVRDLVAFLERPLTDSAFQGGPQDASGVDRPLILGEFLGQPVVWSRDTEYADRLFIVLGGTSPSKVRVSVAEQGFVEFLEALRQVRDEVQPDGPTSSLPQ